MLNTREAVRGGGSKAKANGSALRASGSPDCDLISNLYSAPSLREGTKRSHMPLPGWFRIGWRRPSHLLKSPTTLTLLALGAQTAKQTPDTPLRVSRWAP